MSKQDTTTRANNRPKRVPIHRSKFMDAGKIPGKVLRWVNDKPGRIQQFLNAGYHFVTPEQVDLDPRAQDASKFGTPAATKLADSHSGMKAYLMAIDEDLYREDQIEKQQVVDAMERRTKVDAVNQMGGAAGTYGDIKIGHKD